MLPGLVGLIPGLTGASSKRTWVSTRGPGLAALSIDHIDGVVIVVIIRICSLPNLTRLRTEDRALTGVQPGSAHTMMSQTAPICCPDMHSAVPAHP